MRTTGTTCLLLCAILFVAPSPVSGSPITVPTDLNPGDHYRLAFVTSTLRDATSGNIADYNAFVTAAANSVPELAALGTVWEAIGSTSSTSAYSNINPTTGFPIYRLDGHKLLASDVSLPGAVLNYPINITETGNPSTDYYPYTDVWTGSQPNLTKYYALGSLDYCSIGRLDHTYDWLYTASAGPTTNPMPFYAISETLTVVPEPGAIVLWLSAVGALAAYSWRRRDNHGDSLDGGAFVHRLTRRTRC